jgi:hypothetical protein
MPQSKYIPNFVLGLLVTFTFGLIIVSVVFHKNIEALFVEAFVILGLLQLFIEHIKKVIKEILS